MQAMWHQCGMAWEHAQQEQHLAANAKMSAHELRLELVAHRCVVAPLLSMARGGSNGPHHCFMAAGVGTPGRARQHSPSAQAVLGPRADRACVACGSDADRARARIAEAAGVLTPPRSRPSPAPAPGWAPEPLAIAAAIAAFADTPPSLEAR